MSSYVNFDFKAPLVELMGIWEGIKMTKSLGFGKIIVEVGRSQAIRLVSKENEVWGEVEAWVEATRSFYVLFL